MDYQESRECTSPRLFHCGDVGMKTYDVRVREFVPLVSPTALQLEIPETTLSTESVIEGRRVIQDIIEQKDRRLLVVVGPCSIHDSNAALEYAERLSRLASRVRDTMYLVMRVYFEKPRTSLGWKGLINDPHLDGSCDMTEGLRLARSLLLQITSMGLPTATELLDPITPQYIAGLVCWAAVGARTTESQTHREMASGLSMPVGFKNQTDGSLSSAINAMIAAGSPQSFLGIDPNGRSSIVQTKGNPYTHIVLRGGRRPNYDSASIAAAAKMLSQNGLPSVMMVDCSHGNSRKRHHEQTVVWNDVIDQRVAGNDSIIGLMLESNLNEGRQDLSSDTSTLKYGVSITDACISWKATEALILEANEQLLHSGSRSSALGATS
jgi:3-deoxy-7-phosphoheptulonate synthase